VKHLDDLAQPAQRAAEGAVVTEKGRRLPLKRTEWPRIRDTKKAGSKSRYVLDLRPHVYGQGSRLYFENLEDAKIKAKELATEHRNKGVEAIDFPTELRVEAAECNALLKPHGVTLRKAVDHYLAWLKDENHRNSSRRVKECIDDYLALREMQRKTGELASHTIRETRTRMKQFKAAWGDKPIMAITRATVKEYFDNQQAAGMKPRSADSLPTYVEWSKTQSKRPGGVSNSENDVAIR
jgi:hypothetical protein